MLLSEHGSRCARAGELFSLRRIDAAAQRVQRRAKVQIRRMYKCADLSFVHLGKVVEGAQSLSALDVMRDVVVGSNFVGWQIGYSSLQSSGMGEPLASVCGSNLDGCSPQTCSAISMNRHKSETRGT